MIDLSGGAKLDRGITLTFALIGVTGIWGATFVVMQDAIRGYSALSFLALRFGIAALLILPFAIRGMRRSELMTGMPIGLVLAVAMLAQTVGLRTTTTTSSGFITGLYVIFTPLIAMAFFKARIAPRVWLAVGVSSVGLVLIAGGRPADWKQGDLLTLIAAALFALHISLLSRYAPGKSASALAFGQMLSAALLLAAAAVASGGAAMPGRVGIWWALLVTGLGASAIGFWVQTRAQRRLPAARTAIIMATEPVFAAIAGYLAAGDRLTPVQATGAALMLAALGVAEIWPYVRRPVRSALYPQVTPPGRS